MSDKSLIILCGSQGSGKTTYAKSNLVGYNRISQDEQGKSNHFEIFKKYISQGNNVVIDRINHTKDQRKKYIAIAKDAGYETKIIVLQESYKVCHNRIMSRKDHPTLPNDSKQAHEALAMFKFQYQKPSKSEADVIEYVGEDKDSLYDMSKYFSDKKFIIVGDIHGAYDEFQELLTKCKYNEDSIVIATGDLIDRGEKIKETLEFFMDNPNAFTVMGNHDYKFLRYLLGRKVNVASLEKTIEQTKDMDKNKLIAFFMSMPYMIKFKENSYVVHAGIDPRYGVEKQRKDSLLYVRELNIDNQAAPWYKFYDGESNIFFGHHVIEEVSVHKNCYALDGGAVFGKELRACIFKPNGDFTFESVKAHKEYVKYGSEQITKEGENMENNLSIPENLKPYENMVALGYVNKKVYKDLWLYNYSPKCMYDGHWNETTLNARGTIFDSVTGEIVAKTLPKFFNLNEREETKFANLPHDLDFEVLEKLDGSFISISYWNSGKEWTIASRGSFESEQAKQATKIAAEKWISGSILDKRYSYICEVIYPENRFNVGARLVVDYGSDRTLVLLTIFDKFNNCVELSRNECEVEATRLGLPICKKYSHSLNELIDLQKTLPSQIEGFVVRFSNGTRIKIKTDEYIRMNKILNSISEKAVWESMVGGKVPQEYLITIPEEVKAEVLEWKRVLEGRHYAVVRLATEEQKHLPPTVEGENYFKTIGLHMKDNSHIFLFPKLVFPMLHKKDVSGIVKNIIKPNLANDNG